MVKTYTLFPGDEHLIPAYPSHIPLDFTAVLRYFGAGGGWVLTIGCGQLATFFLQGLTLTNAVGPASMCIQWVKTML